MDVASLANKPLQTEGVEEEAAAGISRLHSLEPLTQVVGKQMG